MAIRHFALAYGVVFLLVGVAGFIPALVAPYDPAHPELAIDAGEGLLFGLFPVNVLHNLTHLAFGVWGILAWRGQSASLAYARIVAGVYAVFVLLGLIPGLMTVFGLVPLHGHDIWLHALLAGVAAYFASTHRETAYAPHPTRTGGGYATGHAGGGSGHTRTTDEPAPPLPSTSSGSGAATRYAAGDRSADAPYAPGNESGDSQYASGNTSGSREGAAPASAGGMLEPETRTTGATPGTNKPAAGANGAEGKSDDNNHSDRR